jgi:hypothetical protein
MLVAGGGVAVVGGGGGGVVAGAVVDGVVGRTPPDTVDTGCVVGSFLGDVVEGVTADGGAAAAGAVPGSAQLGGLAGTVEMLLARLLVGDLVVGSGEDCAAGEAGAPAVTTGWLGGRAVAGPECPVRALTAA